jgi:hypothetical protein
MQEIRKNIVSEVPKRIIVENLLWASRERKNILDLFKGLYLKGTVTGSSFKFKTLDSPPMLVEGVYQELEEHVEVTIVVKVGSLKNGIKGLAYGLGYPIVFVGVLLGVIYHPTSLKTYILSVLALIIPHLIYKWYYYFEYHEPNPERLIKYLETVIKNEQQLK